MIYQTNFLYWISLYSLDIKEGIFGSTLLLTNYEIVDYLFLALQVTVTYFFRVRNF